MSNQNNLCPITIRTVVDITDPEYFCNKSWTLSFNFNTKTWISFHSYIPNWYVAENNFFYSGLNEGCDLEAIAFEELGCLGCKPVPTTTSTSTTICLTCKPAPEPTTSTTTTILYCDLIGEAIELTCTLDGIAIDTTPTTTTSSTTSTTTTICPCCNTYSLTNTSDYPQTVTYISCTEQDQRVITVNIDPNSTFNVCSCQDPVVPTCVTSSIIGSGCIECFCYTIYNGTSAKSPQDIDVQWGTCDESIGQATLGTKDPLVICAKQGTITAIGPITILGGTISCSSAGDCSVITTTTTTTNYCTTTSTTTL